MFPDLADAAERTRKSIDSARRDGLYARWSGLDGHGGDGDDPWHGGGYVADGGCGSGGRGEIP
jgi:hypothetical protein